MSAKFRLTRRRFFTSDRDRFRRLPGGEPCGGQHEQGFVRAGAGQDEDTGEDLAEGFWLTIPATTSFGPTSSVGQFVTRDPILGVTEISL